MVREGELSMLGRLLREGRYRNDDMQVQRMLIPRLDCKFKQAWLVGSYILRTGSLS